MALYARAAAMRGVGAVSLHPGVVNTELQRHILPEGLFEWGKKEGMLQDLLRGASGLLGLKTAVQGAQLSLKLATDAEGDYEKGALYFDKSTKARKTFVPLLYDDEMCNKVMDDTLGYLETFVKEKGGKELVFETAVLSQ